MLLEHRLTLVLRATRSASAGFDAFGFFFCGETALLALRFAEVLFVRWRNVNSLFRREYEGGRGVRVDEVPYLLNQVRLSVQFWSVGHRGVC
jgi:hypothetical protein